MHSRRRVTNLGLTSFTECFCQFQGAITQFVADSSGDGPGRWEGSPLTCGSHTLGQDLMYAVVSHDVVFMRISCVGMHFWWKTLVVCMGLRCCFYEYFPRGNACKRGPRRYFYEYFLRGNAFLVEDTCSVYGAQSCFYS